MTWTTIATFQLTTDWQFTEPIAGSFFQFQHDNAPNGGLYLIAQAEIDSDQQVLISESQILSVDRGFFDVIKFVKPDYFTNRRLAIRKLPVQPTIEEEFKRLLIPSILQPLIDIKATTLTPWSVVIQVSDATPNPVVDLSAVQSKLNAVSTQIGELNVNVDLSPILVSLNTINTKLDALQKSQSSTGSNSTSSEASVTKILTYSSDGDTNGVCYWLGTNYGKESWTNPHTAGRLTCFISSSYDGNDLPQNLVDRQMNDRPATQNIANSSMGIDLGGNNKLKCNCYSLRGRNVDSANLKSWKFQGLDDTGSWMDIDIQNNNPIQANVWVSIPINSNVLYRKFRILQTGVNTSGDNIMCLGELELYGVLQTTTPTN